MPSHDEMLAFNKLFEKHPQFPTICIECVPKGTELPYIRYIIGELWLGLDVQVLNGTEVNIDHDGNTNDVDMWTLIPWVSKYQKAFTIWQEHCPSLADKPPSFGPTIQFGN